MRFLSPRRYHVLKRSLTWSFILVALVGVVNSYAGIYVLIRYFASARYVNRLDQGENEGKKESFHLIGDELPDGS